MTQPCCSRRALLGASVLSSLGLLLRPGRAGAADAIESPPVLVCVFLRGAADGLNMVVPHAEPEYYRLRPTIAVPRPGERQGAIDLDGRFGLHPRLGPLKDAFDAKQLAVVHAVGSPHPTRSHFEAQDYMETAAVGNRSPARGWLAGYLTTRPATGNGALRAVAISGRSPLALRGYRDAVVVPSLRDFKLRGNEELDSKLAEGFRRLYDGNGGLAERAGQRALDATSIVRRALSKGRRQSRGYGRDTQDFADVAKLIKANVGLETAWLDLGGWDTHRQQGGAEGDQARQLDRLARALAAFRADLGSAFERVVVLVMSEFGRTVRENGTRGTDHGHGNCMLVLGGSVQGGRVLGTLPSLSADQLFEGRDLPVTTDFRDVLGEVCERHLRLNDAGPLFPGFQLDVGRRLGLFA